MKKGGGAHYSCSSWESPFVLQNKPFSATFPWMINKELPLVAIVGRPNVGKSTLFNALVGERRSIVSDIAGTTRDTLIDKTEGTEVDYWLLDTAGLTDHKGAALEEEIQKQVELTCEESELILFLLDAKSEITADDRMVAERLRKSKTPFLFVANKIDDGDATQALDLTELGLGMPLAVSAKNYTNIWELQEEIEKKLKASGFGKEEEKEISTVLKLAIVGRPNVGKSSLTNFFAGKERVVVDSDETFF